MDCLTFRRLVLSDPQRTDEVIAEHIAECPQCRAYRRGIRQLDGVLQSAIKLPMPECLPARILLRQSNKSRRIGMWGFSSVIAACCLIAVAIGWHFAQPQSATQWQRAVESYIDQAQSVPDLTSLVAIDDVNALLNEVGVNLSADIGEITAAVPCVIGNRRAAHLVVVGEDGPVTVLIMPDAEIQQRVEFTTEKISGVIAPCPRGSIAVVGGTGEPVNKIRQRFERAITFI
jgi:hypothetical protein